MRTSHESQLLALLLVGALAVASAQNISMVLANYPQFSTFSRLMQQTGVISEVESRNSETILMPDNAALDAYVAAHPSYTTQMVADVLRYHCLLQYFGGDELATLTTEGYIVTTIFQTTGRANGLDGFLNLTKTATGSVTVGPSTPMTPPQANIVTNITQYPYNYSFYQISAVLEPLGLAAAQLAPTTPPTMAPVPAPASVPSSAPVAPMVAPMMAPVSEPVAPPMMTPMKAPMQAPMEAPMKAPVQSPAKTPVSSPVRPPASSPVAAGPVAEGPGAAPASSAFAVRFNAAGVVASLAVAALLL